MNDEFYSMEYNGSATSLEGIGIPDWSSLDDLLASDKEGTILFPPQEISFSSGADSELSTGHQTLSSRGDDVLRTDGMADRLEVKMENALSQSHFFQKVECIESPAQTSMYQNHRKTGRRTRPLSPERKKKVASIRRSGACWSCWLSKIPVRGVKSIL
jgi:hypothetical protein